MNIFSEFIVKIPKTSADRQYKTIENVKITIECTLIVDQYHFITYILIDKGN